MRRPITHDIDEIADILGIPKWQLLAIFTRKCHVVATVSLPPTADIRFRCLDFANFRPLRLAALLAARERRPRCPAVYELTIPAASRGHTYAHPELSRANANTAIVAQMPKTLAIQSNIMIFAYLGMHLILY